MAKQIAFWIDYSPILGYGHLARCRGLVEYLVNNIEYEVIIFVDELNIIPTWLNEMVKKGNTQLRIKSYSEFNSYERQVIDSYLNENFSKGANNSFKHRRVRILDSNHKIRFFNEQDYIVELEILFNDQEKFWQSDYRKGYIKGTIIWNSALENTYDYLKLKGNTNLKLDQYRILINLGNSITIAESLNKILMVLDSEASIFFKQVEVFCNLKYLDKLLIKRYNRLSPLFYEFSDLYYYRLGECDLLICASGNSALEAFHLDQPSLITKLFDNALSNFNALQRGFKNGNFWEIKNTSKGIMGDIVETSLRREYTKNPSKKGVIYSKEFDKLVEFFNS